MENLPDYGPADILPSGLSAAALVVQAAGDFDAETVALVGEAGYRAAMTVETGLVAAGCNRLLLPRYEITRRDHAAFPDRVLELFEQVAKT